MISIWEKESFFAPQDVIIIGAGFVGLWCAYFLKKSAPSLSITLLEKNSIPSGASTRNAGFACFGSLSELMYDANTMGEEKMIQLVQMRHQGINEIIKTFSADDIDFDLCGGYELYSDTVASHPAHLEGQMTYINTLLKDVVNERNTFKKADANISNFQFGHTKHLVYNNLEGSLHPGKLLKGLLQKVQSMGVQVHSGISVKEIENNNAEIEVKTDVAIRFKTKKLVVCTNAFAKDLLPQLDVVPARGQVLVTSPIHNLPFKGTFHSDEGFIYFRNLGNRILLGGARNIAFDKETTTDQQVTDTIQHALEDYLKTVILPHNKTPFSIDHRWSGIMAMGAEKMPIVEQVAGGIFCAVRMSGMGVALAPIAAKKITNLVLDS